MTNSAHPSKPTELGKVALSSTVTVSRYREMEKAQDCYGLADFVKERLSERYITPLRAVPRQKKNGFLMMAAACLLIETLESFYQGWEKTEKGLARKDIEDPCKPTNPRRNTVSAGEVAFCYFFNRQPDFTLLRPHAHCFYKDVRCGILHQSETTGGWRILRKGELFAVSQLTINANKFLAAVRRSVTAYRESLRNADWHEEIWTNFRNKMDTIIDHCKA